MKKIQLIFIILLTISIVPPSNAKDLYKKNLNIKKNDTTLQGWKAWRVTGKKQLKKYEKKNKIKLFSVVNNPTRLGDTAFLIQAPGDECFQRKEDCERNSGTYKRVEAKQTDAGGILGGISTGQEIIASFAVKPTSSILTTRNTVDKFGKNTTISVTGRHDPCVGIRAVPVGEAMMNCVLLDHYLMNKAQCQ